MQSLVKQRAARRHLLRLFFPLGRAPPKSSQRKPEAQGSPPEKEQTEKHCSSLPAGATRSDHPCHDPDDAGRGAGDGRCELDPRILIPPGIALLERLPGFLSPFRSAHKNLSSRGCPHTHDCLQASPLRLVEALVFL